MPIYETRAGAGQYVMPLKPASAPLSVFVHIGVRAEATPKHKEIEPERKVSFDAGERSFVIRF